MAQRRVPHREAHLAHLRAHLDAGRLIMAGALGDPPTGGAFVWRDTPVAEIEAFAADDPYMQAGLITGWRVESWNLV